MTIPLNILIICDNSYFYYSKYLINSIKKNVTIPYKLNCYGIKLKKKHINYLESNNCLVINDPIKLSNDPDITNMFSKSKLSSYCANIRAKVIYDMMIRGDKYILYLDIDSLVRKDLKELFELIKKSNIVIKIREDQLKDYLKVMTGVIGINNNLQSIKFIERWKDLSINENRLYKWYTDQITFTKVMNNYLTEITCLPNEYIDCVFYNRTYIWCGKGNRKKDNLTYLHETRKYK